MIRCISRPKADSDERQVLGAETIAETLGRDNFGLRKVHNCAAESAPGDAVLIE